MEKKNPVSQEELDRMIEEKYRELERLEAERQNREQGGYTSPSYEDAHNFYEGESDTVHRDSLGSTGGYRSASRGEGLTENGNGETPSPTGGSFWPCAACIGYGMCWRPFAARPPSSR